MNKQVSIHEEVLEIKGDKEVGLSLSKYADCLFIFANETGAPGSVLEGKLIEAAGEVICEQEEDFGTEETSPLYEMRVVFGSSEIQFYELLLRRILSLIWEEFKTSDRFRVILNISLPVLSASFDQQAYYNEILSALRKGLPSVL